MRLPWLAAEWKIKLHPAGTIIFPKIGGAISTNKRRVLTRPTAIDNNCLGITPGTDCSTDWLFLLLRSLDLAKYQSGTSVPALSQGVIGRIVTGLPPLAEQHRIVAKVEQLMSLCDELEAKRNQRTETHVHLVRAAHHPLIQPRDHEEFRAAWRRIADNFDRLHTTVDSVKALRQSILQLAVQGKLVPQDPNDEPARVLLEKIRAEKERLVAEGALKKGQRLQPITSADTPEPLASGWSGARLGDVYDIRDGTHDTPKYVPQGFPLVTSKNLSGGSLDLNNVKCISPSDHRKIQERSAVARGDILSAMIGSIGNPVVVDSDVEFSIKNVALFKPIGRDLYCASFLRYFLMVSAERMRDMSAGGVQSFVSLGFLRRYSLRLPPIAEQHRIVAKVDQLMALCDALEAKIEANNSTAEHFAEAVVAELAA